MSIVEKHSDGVCFKVRVQPRASKNELKGVHGDSLKMRITAPPVDGAANEECQRFIAELFCIAKNRVEILSGHSSRNKILKVYGVALEEAIRVLGI